MMAEMTISDQTWEHIAIKHGGGAIDFSPQIAGQMIEEYQQEMARLGFCSYCEGKLGDENHKNGQCAFKTQDEVAQ